MNETRRTTTPFDNKGNKPMWKEIAIGGTTGILLAGAGIALTAFTTPGNIDSTDDNSADNADETASAESASTAAGLYDDMSFADAFAAARSEMGPGGVFTWHGNSYGTYLKSEWDAMTEGQRESFAENAVGTSSNNADHHDVTPGEDVANHDIPDNKTEAQTTSQSQEGELAQNEGGETIVTEPTVNAGAEPFPVDSEIEFVSIEQVELMDDGTLSNVGTAIVNGQEVLLIDVNGDGDTFDLMAADFNGNGQLEDNEIVDISDQNISVGNFAQSVEAGAKFVGDEDIFITENDDNLEILDIAGIDDSAPDVDTFDYTDGDIIG